MLPFRLSRRELLRLSGGAAIAPVVAASLPASLTGCSPANSSPLGQPSQLILSVLSDPKTFNYALSQESPNVFGIIYEGLIEENPLTGKLEPALAASWTLSQNGRQIRVKLRPDLRWSDGQPLTAADVVFTYNEVFFNPALPVPVRDVLRVGKDNALPTVTQRGELEVEFAVPEPFAPFLRSLGSAILPAHALRPSLQRQGSDGKPEFLTTWGVDTPPQDIVGSGPYRLAEYKTSQRVVFDRNPHYWRRGPEGQPQPYIDRLVWQIVESQDTALLQFRSGGLDTLGVSPDNFSLLKREEKRGNFTIYTGGPATGTTFVAFNLNRGKREGKPLVDPVKSAWFNTVKFRQAVACAIDRPTMINNIFRGLGQPQDSPISVQSPFYFPPREGLATYPYNLDRARQLLQEAGFRNSGNNELYDAQGNRVRFTLLTNAGNKIREAMGAQIANDLGKIGIKVDFQPIAFSALVAKLSDNFDWECHLLGFTGGTEPNDGANIWRTDGRLHAFNQSPDPGQPPLVGQVIEPWEAELDRLYRQGAQELDEAKRKVIYAKTQMIAQEYLPFIHLINPLSMAAVRNTLQGVRYSALGGALWNLYELKLIEA